MSNWWVSREAVKAAAKIHGAEHHARVDRIIEAVSRMIERRTRRFYIPRTESRTYRWPTLQRSQAGVLWLDQDLIAITTLQSEAQNSSPTTISSSDYFLEPNNERPPYLKIEIDLSSSAAFQAGDTPQRSISVAGRWGYSENTKSAGVLATSGGLSSDATATSMLTENGSLIDVGDTLLIESEQVFVTEVANANLASILINGALVKDLGDATVAVDGSTHGLKAGEVIQVDSERMFIRSISSNDLSVIRGWDGTQVAAHTDDTQVQAVRTYTIERGINGTTAATHADATAVSKYEPEFDIVSWALAEVISAWHQENAGWGRTVGTGEGAREMSSKSLDALRKSTLGQYLRVREAAV